MIVETAIVVNSLDKLINGRVRDLELLKSVAESINIGAPPAEVHRKLLLLARSSREAFQSLQDCRATLAAHHVKSTGGEIAPVVDRLTGLPNKSALEIYLKQKLRAKDEASDTVLMLVEIGALQMLASELGVKMANRVVKRFAAILRRTVKHTDFIARIGPQHFAIVLQKILPEKAAAIALRIHEIMEGRLSPSSETVMRILSVAVGIAGIKAEGDGAAAILQRAHEAVVAARKQGVASIYVA